MGGPWEYGKFVYIQKLNIKMNYVVEHDKSMEGRNDKFEHYFFIL